MRARWTPILAFAAVAALMALPAIAQEDEVVDSADRTLLHSYDPSAMQLYWSAFTTPEADSEEPACEIAEEGSYTIEEGEEGELVVTPVAEEGAEEAEAVENCDLNATDVTGPNGQVNHGSVVSNFVKALREAGYEGGMGCYVRLIAQSEYGKGDQQVKVSDIDDNEEDEEGSEEEPSELSFTVSETTCGGPDDSDDDAKGKPEWAGKGKPDWAGNGPPPWAGPNGDKSQKPGRGR